MNGFVAGYGLFRLLAVNFGVDRDKAFLLGAVYCLFAQLNILPELSFEYGFLLVVSLLADPGRRVWLAAAMVVLLSATSYPIVNGPPSILGHGVLLILLWTHGSIDIRRQVLVAAIYWTGFCIAFVPNLATLLDYVPYITRDYSTPHFFDLAAIARYFGQATASVVSDQLLIYAIPGALIGTLCCARWDLTLRVAAVLVLGVTLLCGFLNSQLFTLLHGTFLQKMDLYHVVRFLPQSCWVLLGLALDRTTLDRGRTLRYAAGSIGAIVFAAYMVPYNPSPYLTPALLMAAAAGLVCADSLDFSTPNLQRQELIIVTLAAAILAWGVYHGEKTNRARYNFVYGNEEFYASLLRDYQHDPFRVVIAGFSASAPQMAGIETVDGHGSVFDRSFRDLLAFAAVDGASNRQSGFWSNWHDLNLTDLVGYPFDGAAIRLPVLGALNVRYILAKDRIAGLEAVPMAQSSDPQSDPIYAYRVPDSLPRGRFAPSPILTATYSDARRALMALPAEEWGKTAVFAREDGAPAALPKPQQVCGTAQLETYQPDRLVFQLTAQQDCTFVVANNYNSRWHANIDGTDVKVYRVDLAFQAVVVSRGAKTLTMTFRPPFFPAILALIPLGVALSFLSLYVPGATRRPAKPTV